MNVERGDRHIENVRREIAALKSRVIKLEAEMHTMKTDMGEIKEISEAILGAVTSAKPWIARAKKVLPPLITFAIGAGYLNPELAAIFSSIFQ